MKNKAYIIIQLLVECLMLPVFFVGVGLCMFAIWFADDSADGKEHCSFWRAVRGWLEA